MVVGGECGEGVLVLCEVGVEAVRQVLPKTLLDSRGLDLSLPELEVLILLGILHRVPILPDFILFLDTSSNAGVQCYAAPWLKGQ